ncbi:MAG: ABC transporter permease, partial [Actinomycetota bacterium]
QSEPGDEGVAFVPKPGLDAAAAEAAVDADEAAAVVVIPAGFGAAVQGGEVAELHVLGDAGDDLTAGIARSVADGIAREVQTQRAAITTTLTAAAQLGQDVPPDAVSRVAADTPAAIEVRDSRFENTFSMMAFFAPGMAMIFLFFVMGAAARSLVTERREGTLSRMLAGPTSPTAVLLGKTLGVLTLGFTSLLVVWGITAVGFRVDWGHPLGVLMVIIGAVVAIAGISLVITGLARTEAQSESLTIVFALVLGVLGGTFVYTASGFLAEVRRFTPNGQALMAFVDLAAGNAGPADVLPAFLLLLGGGLAVGLIGLLAIRRGIDR